MILVLLRAVVASTGWSVAFHIAFPHATDRQFAVSVAGMLWVALFAMLPSRRR